MNDLKSQLLDLFEKDTEIKQAITNIISSVIDQTNSMEIPESQQDRLEIENISELLSAKENDNKKLLSDIEQLNTKLSTVNQEHSEEIQRTLKELEGNQQMLKKLKELLGCEKDNNKSFQTKIEQLKDSLESEKKESRTLKKTIKKKDSQVKHYEALFEEEIEAHELFKSLSNNTHKSLSGIFKDDSMTGFIACGLQERNINNLWEYIKNEDIEGENIDLTSLKTIFSFLFSRYIIAYPIYEVQQVKVDEAFDSQSHIKHSNSKNVSGKIQEVSLHGWINIKTNKIVKQSVVII